MNKWLEKIKRILTNQNKKEIIAGIKKALLKMGWKDDNFEVKDQRYALSIEHVYKIIKRIKGG